jgi:hypothetical protein
MPEFEQDVPDVMLHERVDNAPSISMPVVNVPEDTAWFTVTRRV